MTGSLQAKNQKYYIVLNTYDKSGKRKQKWIPTNLPEKGNKRQALKLLQKAVEDYESRHGQPDSEMYFADAVRRWLENVTIRIDEVTWQGYNTLAQKHILPYFDDLGVQLCDVTRQTLQEYINEKYQSGNLRTHGKLSPASLRLHKNILYQTLKEAMINGLIPTNPCEFVILPQMQRHEGRFLSVEQLNKLLDAIREERLYPVVLIASLYGLRRSELLGLKWDSVDFEAGTVTIKHTVCKVTGLVEKDKTKNKSSYRTFPLLPDARAVFCQFKEQEQENRKLFGREYAENEYIFKWEDGRPYAPDYVSQTFNHLLKKYNFPHISFHELRHSCASNLLMMGFTLKDVQEWLGHANIRMTADVYGHLDVKRKQEIGNALAQRIG